MFCIDAADFLEQFLQISIFFQLLECFAESFCARKINRIARH